MSLCNIAKFCVRFMLILIDDDFSHIYVYIPTEQIKTVSFFFLCPIIKNPRWPPLISFRYIITNNEHKNTKSMSFVVSNPSERPGYHILMKKIQIILNYGLNCIKILLNSCIHYRLEATFHKECIWRYPF